MPEHAEPGPDRRSVSEVTGPAGARRPVTARDFEHLAQGLVPGRLPAGERALTKGYAVLRRTRQAVRRCAGA